MGAVSDEEAIRGLLATYCQTVDDGRFDEWEQIWTDDATFTVMGTAHAGRAALRSFIEAAQPPERRGKHLTVNHVVEVRGDEATAASDFAFAGKVDGGWVITQVGRYLDRLERTPEGWRIAAREIVLGSGGGQEPG